MIVWYRRDLRVSDHPALHEAAGTGRPVVPLFIWDPDSESPWAPGAATRWWLDGSLRSLARSLESMGSRLIVRAGSSLDVLRGVIRETRAGSVLWSRVYEPAARERDTAIKTALQEDAVDVQSFNASLLFEPWQIETQQGAPYQVFTPFYKACQLHGDPGRPLTAPRRLATPGAWPQTLEVADLRLLPRIPWDAGLRASWEPGERGAAKRAKEFTGDAAAAYATRRDLPADEGTSRVSPHLHFGEISPAQVWHAILGATPRAGATPYLRQLIWREFAHHLLYHFPRTTDAPLRDDFARFPWKRDDAALRAWQLGRTGYPIVDAGMRELWRTGWMHNRVRMIVASFLVKDLLIPWQDGARWFWDTLVDADLANNTLGWQWTAGCGADAAPYFRIFNPILQASKFDADGGYVRRWVPELAGLPDEWIHRPFEAPGGTLRAAGIRLGETYPNPIVDHSAAREVALAAYDAIRSPRIAKR